MFVALCVCLVIKYLHIMNYCLKKLENSFEKQVKLENFVICSDNT